MKIVGQLICISLCFFAFAGKAYAEIACSKSVYIPILNISVSKNGRVCPFWNTSLASGRPLNHLLSDYEGGLPNVFPEITQWSLGFSDEANKRENYLFISKVAYDDDSSTDQVIYDSQEHQDVDFNSLMDFAFDYRKGKMVFKEVSASDNSVIRVHNIEIEPATRVSHMSAFFKYSLDSIQHIYISAQTRIAESAFEGGTSSIGLRFYPKRDDSSPMFAFPDLVASTASLGPSVAPDVFTCPACDAGIEPGDKIVAVDGNDVYEAHANGTYTAQMISASLARDNHVTLSVRKPKIDDENTRKDFWKLFYHPIYLVGDPKNLDKFEYKQPQDIIVQGDVLWSRLHSNIFWETREASIRLGKKINDNSRETIPIAGFAGASLQQMVTFFDEKDKMVSREGVSDPIRAALTQKIDGKNGIEILWGEMLSTTQSVLDELVYVAGNLNETDCVYGFRRVRFGSYNHEKRVQFCKKRLKAAAQAYRESLKKLAR